jgi:protein tyrosine phosphatase (PTP) superfamily phosphohydrolase (DUF442 family)
MALEEIKNYVAVSSTLATAGQPTEAQLREVATAGFEVVVNLGLLDPRYCLNDEAALARELDLEYAHIPVEFQSPRIEDFKRFFDVMDRSAGKRTFVHCAANYRVSCFVSLYGQARLGWSLPEARAHIARVWKLNDVWAAFLENSRAACGLSSQ